MDAIIWILIFIVAPIFMIATSIQRRRLKEWGVPRAVEIAEYQGWVSPHRLMNQAHLTKSNAQFLLREASKQNLLYQAVNGRYYIGQPPERSSSRMPRAAKELYSPDGARRLFVIERDDGLFAFREEESSFDEHSRTPVWKRSFTSGLYATAQAAENDARMAIPWLKKV
jgi:hypothetical protein